MGGAVWGVKEPNFSDRDSVSGSVSASISASVGACESGVIPLAAG